jgi:hypothetical protein
MPQQDEKKAQRPRAARLPRVGVPPAAAIVGGGDDDMLHLLRRIVPRLRAHRPLPVLEAQWRWRGAAAARGQSAAPRGD